MRATLRLSSPAWFAQPKYTSSIAGGIDARAPHELARSRPRPGHRAAPRPARPGTARSASEPRRRPARHATIPAMRELYLLKESHRREPGSCRRWPSRIGANVTIGMVALAAGGPVSVVHVARQQDAAERADAAAQQRDPADDRARVGRAASGPCRQSRRARRRPDAAPPARRAPAPRSISSTRFQHGPYFD